MAFINHCLPSPLARLGGCGDEEKTKWDVYQQAAAGVWFLLPAFSQSVSASAFVCPVRLSDRPVKPSGHHENWRRLLSSSSSDCWGSFICRGFVSFQLAHWVDLSMALWPIYLCLQTSKKAGNSSNSSFPSSGICAGHDVSPKRQNANPPPLPFRWFAFYQPPHLLVTWPIRFASRTAFQGTETMQTCRWHVAQAPLCLASFTSLIGPPFALLCTRCNLPFFSLLRQRHISLPSLQSLQLLTNLKSLKN